MDDKIVIKILRTALDTILFEAKEPIIKVYAQSALDQTKSDSENGTSIISCKKHNWFGEHYEKCPLCE